MLLPFMRRRLVRPAPPPLAGEGILMNNGPSEYMIWRPPADCPLPAVVGTWRRVNDWLEEVGFLPRGIHLISGATGFTFQQTVQSQDADGASYNTSVTETALATSVSFLGSGTGTVSGGIFGAGKAFAFHFRGVLSTTATPNWTTNVRVDSTSGSTLGAQTLYATASGINALPFAVDAYVVCRADSTAGVLETFVEYSPGATPGANTNSRQLARANITSFDTTANHPFLITGLWGTSSGSNIGLAKIFIAEVLN
jgi:hypothetical protein